MVLAHILLGSETWGMMGAPISSLACDTLIVAVNLLFLHRYAPAMLPSPRRFILLWGGPTLLAAASVAGAKGLRTPAGWQVGTPIHTLVTVATVACLYGAGALVAQGVFQRRNSRNQGDE